MTELQNLTNIGKSLSLKLEMVGITNVSMLEELGSEKTIIRISSLENNGVCINMLYAIEGAIQGIRWHGLTLVRKVELLDFYNTFINKQ